jgi:AAA+ superfamily predicted ATPase
LTPRRLETYARQPVEPFATSLDHVLAELERIDLLLRLQVHHARKLKTTDDRFAGLYISEQEIDAITGEPAGLPRWATAKPPWSEEDVERAFDELAQSLAARVAASAARGVPLRFEQLAALFELDHLDRDILLLGLAPEIDLRYERLFAYLQDDMALRRPSVDLALNLLSPSLPQKLAARARFTPEGKLLRHRLIELFEDPSRPRASLLGKHLKVDDRIVGYLFGSDALDAALAPYARVAPASPRPELPVAPREIEERAEALAEQAARGRLLVHLHGPRGVGKLTWARIIAGRADLPLLVVDGERAAAAKDLALDVLAEQAAREAALQGAAIYWGGFDALLADDRRAARDAVIQTLAERVDLVFLAGTAPWEGGTAPDAASVLRMEIPLPTSAERAEIWRRALGDDLSPDLSAELTALSSKFRFTAESIAAATADAHARLDQRAGDASDARPPPPPLAIADLYAGARAQSGRRLGELAKKIRSSYAWGDLVLPADAIQQLREICEQVRHRARVFEAWGFERKLAVGRGLNALFSGPSGTGKTMAAGIMAAELGLDLFKVDLSGVVSKYIGETEKNLARVFAEAEATSAILFFDEADALFGKRSEVKDAHDRYANVETSYLLQRMEEYEGVTILATNLRRNLDDAFLRRIAFAVQFPFPEEAERLRIWEGVFPEATPRAPDVDLPFLAKQFKLSGGNIKNVALAAAFLAASDGGGGVSMKHLVRATRRELQKMGKSAGAAEFGAYGSLAEG